MRDPQAGRGSFSSGGGGGASGKGTAGSGGGMRDPQAARSAYNRGDTGPVGKGTAGSGGLTDQQILGTDTPAPVPADERPTFSRRKPGDAPFAPHGPNERWGVTIGTPPDEQAEQDRYNAAWDALENRGLGGWLGDHLKDLIPGMHQVDPEWGRDETYADGIYHDGWSPVAAATGLLGMASPIPGTSVLTGTLGQQISDAIGAPDYTFGSEGKWGHVGSGTPAPDDAAGAGAPAANGTQTASGGTLGGKTDAGGVQLKSFGVLKQKQPPAISINPTPEAAGLMTYYSDGTKPTQGQPVYY